jgi:hypothetical protein
MNALNSNPEFEIGNVYSRRNKAEKVFYLAIRHRTLVTYLDGKFGQFTTKKGGYISESNISVAELCEFWDVKPKKLDLYMSNHFQPDEEAKLRARRERENLEQFQIFSL